MKAGNYKNLCISETVDILMRSLWNISWHIYTLKIFRAEILRRFHLENLKERKNLKYYIQGTMFLI